MARCTNSFCWWNFCAHLWRIKFKAIMNNKTRMKKELFSTDWKYGKRWKNNNKWFDAFASITDHETWADGNKKSWEEKRMSQIVLMNVMSCFCMDFYSPSYIFVMNSDMAKHIPNTDPSSQRAQNETNDKTIKSITKWCKLFYPNVGIPILYALLETRI